VIAGELVRSVRTLGLQLLVRAGFDPMRVGSLRHPLGRRGRLIRALRADLVIDVGASVGEYGSELRRLGYQGRILSFEPLGDPFRHLVRRAQGDPLWDAVQSAIGPTPGSAVLNVAANHGASSSFLPMLQEHEALAPEATYVGTEPVTIRRLDEASRDAVMRANATFLKADVQGYELQVLESAVGILPRVVGLQLELSLVPLYSGAPTFMAVVERARDLGFDLVGLEPGVAAADGRLLQADGLFERSSRAVPTDSGRRASR